MRRSAFEDAFGATATVVGCAPGRVNLLGEHTDYNEGYVLPIAIAQTTCVAMRINGRDTFRLHTTENDDRVEFALTEPPSQHFASYVYGCLRELQDAGKTAPALDILISSDVPIGVGLSSSAALEVATLRALRELLGVQIDDVEIARMGQRAEIRYAGVNVGILDQMASSLADTRHMLFLDTRTLERRLLELPGGAETLIVNSGIARSLATSKYNERRAECEAAAALLGVKALRDVTDLAITDKLPEPLRRRARHVVSEDQRVLDALTLTDAVAFGALMNASHRSLSEDYEVSVADLDVLARLLQTDAEVFGAKLTGAGFGGACVAMCKTGTGGDVASRVLEAYGAATGRVGAAWPSST